MSMSAAPEGCPPAHNGCQCPCHRTPRMFHLVPCCHETPEPAIPDSSPRDKLIFFISLMERLNHVAPEIGRGLRAALAELESDRDVVIADCISTRANGGIPPELDVRKLMLAIVPGDGDGLEVYAKNVKDAEEHLAAEYEREEEKLFAMKAERDKALADAKSWADIATVAMQERDDARQANEKNVAEIHRLGALTENNRQGWEKCHHEHELLRGERDDAVAKLNDALKANQDVQSERNQLLSERNAVETELAQAQMKHVLVTAGWDAFLIEVSVALGMDARHFGTLDEHRKRAIAAATSLRLRNQSDSKQLAAFEDMDFGKTGPGTGLPVQVTIQCPKCAHWHVDEDKEVNMDIKELGFFPIREAHPQVNWAKRPHSTHRCTHCNHEWMPFPIKMPTVGVAPVTIGAGPIHELMEKALEGVRKELHDTIVERNSIRGMLTRHEEEIVPAVLTAGEQVRKERDSAQAVLTIVTAERDRLFKRAEDQDRILTEISTLAVNAGADPHHGTLQQMRWVTKSREEYQKDRTRLTETANRAVEERDAAREANQDLIRVASEQRIKIEGERDVARKDKAALILYRQDDEKVLLQVIAERDEARRMRDQDNRDHDSAFRQNGEIRAIVMQAKSAGSDLKVGPKLQDHVQLIVQERNDLHNRLITIETQRDVARQGATPRDGSHLHEILTKAGIADKQEYELADRIGWLVAARDLALGTITELRELIAVAQKERDLAHAHIGQRPSWADYKRNEEEHQKVAENLAENLAKMTVDRDDHKAALNALGRDVEAENWAVLEALQGPNSSVRHAGALTRLQQIQCLIEDRDNWREVLMETRRELNELKAHWAPLKGSASEQALPDGVKDRDGNTIPGPGQGAIGITPHPARGDDAVALPINHEEARALAWIQREKSNLSRCYLDLAGKYQRLEETWAEMTRRQFANSAFDYQNALNGSADTETVLAIAAHLHLAAIGCDHAAQRAHELSAALGKWCMYRWGIETIGPAMDKLTEVVTAWCVAGEGRKGSQPAPKMPKPLILPADAIIRIDINSPKGHDMFQSTLEAAAKARAKRMAAWGGCWHAQRAFAGWED
jgi:hypothetical protein